MHDRGSWLLWLVVLTGCARDPQGTGSAGQDCDVGAAVEPEVPYDGLDNDCDPTTPDDDIDGDGFFLAEDCDDEDPAVYEDGILKGDLDPVTEPAPCDGYCTLAVAGDLLDQRGTDVDLQRYHCLVSIGGDLTVATSTSLERLSGLDALTQVDGALTLGYLGRLQSLEGLGGLHTVGGLLGIASSGLTSLAGVEGPLQVGGLHLESNPQLGSLAEPGTLRIGGSLIVIDNVALTSLEGVASVQLPAGLTLTGNPELASLAALAGLTGAGPIVLVDNGALQDLVGLDDLSLAGGLHVEDNASLQSLVGLEGLRRIDGDLELRSNDALTDLSALHGLQEVTGDVVLRSNAALSRDAVDALLEAIEVIGGEIDIDPVRGG